MKSEWELEQARLDGELRKLNAQRVLAQAQGELFVQTLKTARSTGWLIFLIKLAALAVAGVAAYKASTGPHMAWYIAVAAVAFVIWIWMFLFDLIDG